MFILLKKLLKIIIDIEFLKESFLINSITISCVVDLILLKDGVIGVYSNKLKNMILMVYFNLLQNFSMKITFL